MSLLGNSAFKNELIYKLIKSCFFNLLQIYLGLKGYDIFRT